MAKKISATQDQFRGRPQVDEEDEEFEEYLDPGRQRSVDGGGPSWRGGGASCRAGPSGRERSSREPQRSSSRGRTSVGLWLPEELLLLSPRSLNLGTYLLGAGAAAAAAGAAADSRGGCATGVESGARTASDPFKSFSLLAFAFSSNSISLSRCFSAIASSLAFLSASSLFLLSSSAGVNNIINNMDELGFESLSSTWPNMEYDIETEPYSVRP